ncbi:hypothetical protein D3C81_1591290 [compost metagenome]
MWVEFVRIKCPLQAGGYVDRYTHLVKQFLACEAYQGHHIVEPDKNTREQRKPRDITTLFQASDQQLLQRYQCLSDHGLAHEFQVT